MFVTLTGTSTPLLGDGVNARTGMCIDKVVVKVQLYHPCINQLRISLMGPGPITGDANFHPHSSSYEVLLLNQPKTHGTGCAGGTHYFEFDDSSPTSTDTCCVDLYNGTYKPEGKISQFIGVSPVADWTLVVEDVKNDSLAGLLHSWSMNFELSTCTRTYSWQNITEQSTVAAGSNWPSPRYQALSISYNNYIFIYGGRDNLDRPLKDLYRYDTKEFTWTQLQPVDFAFALSAASSVGYNILLTSWGVFRYGGYLRQPFMSSASVSGDQYMGDLYLMDPITLRWVLVDAEPWMGSTKLSSPPVPTSRYHSSVVFIPSNALTWTTQFSYRTLFDQKIDSTYANYQGATADSILLFGGHDGASGIIPDGSSGGMLGDMWMFRMANWSTEGNRAKQRVYQQSRCAWRVHNSSRSSSSWARSHGCTMTHQCSLRDLLLLSWCAAFNQTL